MAWRCQVEPYLKHLVTTVIKCEQSSYKINNKKTSGYNVLLSDTVFFPEGGGQPGDAGVLLAGSKAVNVLYTYRDGQNAIHFCDDQLDQGIEVDIKIDWNRRFDNMQQHTGQHLISAIFDRSNNSTTSWNMGEEISFVELEKPISNDAMIEAQEICNQYIRENKSVTVELLKNKDELRSGCKELPEDFAGPIRVINIDGVDQNMCCGTHVHSLGDLQCIKLLHCEKGKKGKGLVWFVCGQRVLNTLNDSWTIQKNACSKLSCQPTDIIDRIDKLTTSSKSSTKMVKNLWREIAVVTAQTAKQSEGKLIKIHRKEADNDFLVTFVNELKNEAENGRVVFGSIGEKGGNISIIGPTKVLDKCGKEVLALLNGKGNCKNGRIQGKVESFKELNEAYEIIQTQLHCDD